ncbi:MAG TPA: hypothetical protein VEK15_28115 [Vicinamibacteria bacterium]|nr:hypothetical protein [Vicinamibacteria bacterium]
MNVRALLTLLVLGLAALSLAQGDAIRPTEITAEQVGQTVVVEGRVYSSNKTAAGIHLYFGADTSTAFQALVTSASIHKFQVDIEKQYSSRNVRVTGKLEEDNGRLFVRIEEPSQIKVAPRKRGTN